jgi:hypothetical protein
VSKRTRLDLRRDDATWEKYLADQGVADRADWLWARFVNSGRNFLPDGSPGRSKLDRTFAFRNWVVDVLDIDVQLLPAGRAILRAPDYLYTLKFNVEMEFERYEDGIRPTRVAIVADPGKALIGYEELDFYLYATAFDLRMQSHPNRTSFARVPRRRPAPGKPLDTAFYDRLLKSYEALFETHRYPAAELARRMNENPSTVRTWLKRARELRSRKET